MRLSGYSSLFEMRSRYRAESASTVPARRAHFSALEVGASVDLPFLNFLQACFDLEGLVALMTTEFAVTHG
jgi:hypothetical protein